MVTADPEQEPSAELAEFISQLSFSDLPADAVETVERCFVDTIGVMLPGADEGAGKLAIEMVAAISEGDIPLFGTDRTASVTDATFANSTAAHSLDFDDDQFEITSHPSATMVPPILTLSAEEEINDGRAAITAYVAGFETQYFLSRAITPSHYERGWHGTSTFGTFGSTAAAAALLNLSLGETRHALNIAASMPAGIYQNFGTMAKPMHAGQAARSGITAALLAAQGFTAASDAISGPNGFFNLYAGDAGVDTAKLPTLGERWALVENGIYMKKYPCCYATHNAIAAAEHLAATEEVTPENVASVRVIVSPGAKEMLTYPDPDTGMEAKFSLQYCVASALAPDSIDLTTFDDDGVTEPTRQALRERIEMVIDTDIPYTDTQATVEIETIDDENYRMHHTATPGSPENQLSEEELRRKFRQCAEQTDRGDLVAHFDNLRDLRNADVAAVTRRLG